MRFLHFGDPAADRAPLCGGAATDVFIGTPEQFVARGDAGVLRCAICLEMVRKPVATPKSPPLDIPSELLARASDGTLGVAEMRLIEKCAGLLASYMEATDAALGQRRFWSRDTIFNRPVPASPAGFTDGVTVEPPRPGAVHFVLPSAVLACNVIENGAVSRSSTRKDVTCAACLRWISLNPLVHDAPEDNK